MQIENQNKIAIELYNSLQEQSDIDRDDMQCLRNMMNPILNGQKNATDVDIASLRDAKQRAVTNRSRLNLCYKRLEEFPKSNIKGHVWLLDQLENNLASAEDDFIQENCENFETGVQVMEDFLKFRAQQQEQREQQESSILGFVQSFFCMPSFTAQ